MKPTFPAVAELVRVTLRDPAAGARELIGLGLSMQARWLAFALVIVLSAILTQIAILGMPPDGSAGIEAVLQDPLFAVLVQGTVVLISAVAIVVVGGWFGGQARFPDALLLMTWMEFILLVVQTAQILFIVVLPPLGLLLAVAAGVIFFWLLVGFTAYLNGFRNRGLVFLGVIGTFFAVAFLLVTVAAMFGWPLPGMPDV
ncbi:MAG: YIP1 family protein [Paracoccaceae bacterium]